METHIVVALDSIDESLVGHNLCFSIEESLETLFDGLQLLLTDLKDTRDKNSSWNTTRSWMTKIL